MRCTCLEKELAGGTHEQGFNLLLDQELPVLWGLESREQQEVIEVAARLHSDNHTSLQHPTQDLQTV